MVIDLVDSTPIIARAPRVRMSEIMTDVATPVRNAIEDQGGTVIEFTGDGY
jgi:class 3 adenylate cyclase